MDTYCYIKKNYSELVREINSLGEAAGRKITLVAVTKSGSDEELLALASAGCQDIGENRPGELARRGELLLSRGFTPVLHEVGHLQRNKVKYIAGTVGLIHSLDSLPLAEEINARAGRLGRRIPVLIEINSAREPQKGGIMPEDAEEFFLRVRELANISVVGLMTIGPVCDGEEIRPYFRLTRGIFDRLNELYGFEGGGILSMGMSDSYRIAIEEGATLVRVGRRLFNKNEN